MKVHRKIEVKRIVPRLLRVVVKVRAGLFVFFAQGRFFSSWWLANNIILGSAQAGAVDSEMIGNVSSHYPLVQCKLSF